VAKAALAMANELASTGSYADAISALTDANRTLRDPGIEERLVELRWHAYEHLSASPGPTTWPPEADDLFPDALDPPEVSPSELTHQALKSAIRHHGSLLVRGLIDRHTVRRLVKNIDRAFAAYDASVTNGGRPASPWFTPYAPGAGTPDDFAQRSWLRESGGILAVESPPSLFEVIEAFERAGIGRLVRSFLGEPPLLLARKWTLRRISSRVWAPGDVPDWHQDGAFMGVHVHSINIWLALSHCGHDAPGLDLVARRFDDIVETGTHGANFDWSVGQGVVDRMDQPRVARPRFAPGDALIFDHLLLHRTATDPKMKKSRYAIEAWFAGASSYPADQGPIVY
jgi:hypothetical protein